MFKGNPDVIVDAPSPFKCICGKSFENNQGLGSHQNHCQQARAAAAAASTSPMLVGGESDDDDEREAGPMTPMRRVRAAAPKASTPAPPAQADGAAGSSAAAQSPSSASVSSASAPPGPSSAAPPGRRGVPTRQTYLLAYKYRVANLVVGLTFGDTQLHLSEAIANVVASTSVPETNVRRWYEDRQRLKESFTIKGGKYDGQLFTRIMGAPRASVFHLHHKSRELFPDEEKQLYDEYRKRRDVSMYVSGQFLRIRMLALVRAADAASKFKASRRWLLGFCERYSISWRRRTTTKSLSVNARLPKMLAFFARLVHRVSRGGPHADPMGRFPARLRVNADETGFGLGDGPGSTWADKGETHSECGFAVADTIF